MANETTNLKLTKPEYTDTADIADINDNMDTLDGAVNGLQRDLAILANGNTHAAIEEGQYVYIRNHSSLAEGLYKANQTIAANSSLTSSKVTAVGAVGILNGIKAQLDAATTALANGVKSSILSDGQQKASRTYSVLKNSRFTFVSTSTSTSKCFMIIVIVGSDGAVRIFEIAKGSQVDFDISVPYKLTVNWNTDAYSFGFVLASGQSSADAITQDN